MRLILEKAEIVTILSRHFESELDPEKVIIRTDPVLEIEVSGIPLPAPEKAPAAVSARVTTSFTGPEPLTRSMGQLAVPHNGDPNVVVADIPPDNESGANPVAPEGLSPAAMMAWSRSIQEQLDRDNPNLARRNR